MNYTNEEAAAVHEAGQAKAELAQTSAAFADLRRGFIDALLATDAAATAERERLYLAVRVLDRVKSALEAKVSGAAVAEHSAEIRAIMAGADAG